QCLPPLWKKSPPAFSASGWISSMLFMLPGTTTRFTASKFFRYSSSFHIARPCGSGCRRSGVPEAWHEMQRAWPGRLATQIGCTLVLNVSEVRDGGGPARVLSAAARNRMVVVTGPPLPRNRVGVDARIGAGAQHARLRIDHDRGQRSHRPRTGDAQRVAARGKAVADRLRDALLHRHLARIHGVRER